MLKLFGCMYFCCLSPVLTVPVLPRFAPVKTSRYTVIKRGTFSTKIDRVLAVTVLPRCSPGLIPGSTTVSSRRMLVCPGFTTVRPGSVPVHPGGVPVTASHATVLPRCFKTIATLVTAAG